MAEQRDMAPASAAQRALIRGPYFTPKWPGSFIVSIQTQSAKLYHLRTIKGKTHLAYIRGGESL